MSFGKITSSVMWSTSRFSVLFRNFNKNAVMEKSPWNELLTEMQLAAQKVRHPFRFSTLATLGLENLPRLRTVVIRHFVEEPLRITFFTDYRSKKVMHIKENNKVSLLCYHPERMLQIRFDGVAERETDQGILELYKSQLPEPTRIEYKSATRPGSVISGPEQLEYLEDGDFFTAIHIYPFKAEYLKLNRPRHTRIRFSRTDLGWNSDLLAP